MPVTRRATVLRVGEFASRTKRSACAFECAYVPYKNDFSFGGTVAVSSVTWTWCFPRLGLCKKALNEHKKKGGGLRWL